MIIPKINPIALEIGILKIRWYSLAYILGILIGWYLAHKIVKKLKLDLSEENLGDYIVWAILSIIFGGRIGYVIFYDFQYFIMHPIEIIKIYKGGMSFHGALVFYIAFTYVFAKKNKLDCTLLLDLSSLVAPIGLFLGRIGNFINSELYGRITDVPWGVIYPSVDFKTRHPSQIYEALLEGIMLFMILNYLNKKFSLINFKLIITSLFLILYSLFRMYVEFYREPDKQVGFFLGYFTLGQILSSVMFLVGCVMIVKIKKNLDVYKR